jgi:very-short-patch-repair endonuclease
VEDSRLKVKEMKPNLIEYWLSRGFSVEESKLQTELHLMNTERAFIIKYGSDEGVRLFKEKKIKEGKLHSPRSIDYWVNKGYSNEESKNKVSEVQNKFSLVKCIEKYGDEEGLKVFTERQNKWQKSLLNNGNMKLGYSKISQELFYSILETYDVEYRDKIKFATHNGEFKINNPKGGVYVYDFIDVVSKKIIEYNGDMYHANPKKFKENDTPHPYRKSKTSIEIWESDKNKLDVANDNGYEVLVIWDSEYRWGNKEKVIKKCLKFLKNED